MIDLFERMTLHHATAHRLLVEIGKVETQLLMVKWIEQRGIRYTHCQFAVLLRNIVAAQCIQTRRNGQRQEMEDATSAAVDLRGNRVAADQRK